MSDRAELSLLLVTANVGTLFEQPDRLLTSWLDEFCSKVSREQPDFVALHCQEVGGKSFATGMKDNRPFVDRLLTEPILSEYTRVRAYFDENYETKTEFTALGSIYLVHSRVKNAAMWDYTASRFQPVTNKEVCRIKVDDVKPDRFHIKHKYTTEEFPQFPVSRKGHIMTRWKLRGRKFDMVNVHLFAGVSNLESVSKSPSIYAETRCKALQFTLQKLDDLALSKASLFVFGDFNFRVDLKSIVDGHFAGCTARPVENSGGTVTSISYHKEGEETPVLTLEQRGFVCRDRLSQKVLMKWRKFDREFNQFPELRERKITFPPSYPLSEDIGVTSEYMQTRPPSWCDRVLYNKTANKILKTCASPAVYGLLGADAEMGDHKPVFLSAVLPPIDSTPSPSEKSPVKSKPVPKSNGSSSSNGAPSGKSKAKSENGSDNGIEPPAKQCRYEYTYERKNYTLVDGKLQN